MTMTGSYAISGLQRALSLRVWHEIGSAVRDNYILRLVFVLKQWPSGAQEPSDALDIVYKLGEPSSPRMYYYISKKCTQGPGVKLSGRAQA